MSIATYYGKLNALWEQLSLLEPPSVLVPLHVLFQIFIYNVVKLINYMNF